MSKYVKNRKVCIIFAILLFMIGLCVAFTKPEAKEGTVDFIGQYELENDAIRFGMAKVEG